MAEWEHTQNTRQRAGQGLPEPFALARIRVQRCRPRRFGQTFTGSSPQHPREKRLQPLSRAPIACARRVGAPCIVSDLQKLQQSSKSFDFRKRRYPCRRYRRVPIDQRTTRTVPTPPTGSAPRRPPQPDLRRGAQQATATPPTGSAQRRATPPWAPDGRITCTALPKPPAGPSEGLA